MTVAAHRNGPHRVRVPPDGPVPARRSVVLVLGLGTDIIEVVRIGEMIERHGEIFLQRVYTEQEIRYCQRRKAAIQHYAGRWAAKEAVMKTLGTGFSKGVGFRDIEVTALKSGRPIVTLHGGAQEIAGKLGIDEVLISISHCRAYATATAIAMQHARRD
jgi:holo-[acyl-carrier protein] synthase